jgi:hypothetical protein
VKAFDCARCGRRLPADHFALRRVHGPAQSTPIDEEGPGSWCRRCYEEARPKHRSDCLKGGWYGPEVRWMRPESQVREAIEEGTAALRKRARVPLTVLPTVAPCEWSLCRYRLPLGQCVLDLAEDTPGAGMDDPHPRTLEEVAAALGIVKERVRQIEMRARLHLWHALKHLSESRQPPEEVRALESQGA